MFASSNLNPEPGTWNLRTCPFLEKSLRLSIAQTYYIFMLDWSDCPAVDREAGKVSGAWLFRGTRVPVKALFENLEDGARVDDFLEWFPGVTREQAEAVLEHARRSLVEV